MKSLIGKLGMVALLATAAGGVVAGCSSSQVPGTNGSHSGSEGPQGDVTLKLVPVSGVTLNTVHYVVANSATPATTVSEGDLPTPGNAKDFSFGLSLPVGTGYTISLSAASAETGDNITCGGSFGPFNVTPNNATNFSLTLTCHDDTNGQIIGGVDVKTDACPKIVFDYAVATPGSQDIGKTIAVLAKAHDLDGKALTYSWKVATPATGTFSPVTGDTSTFTCNTAKPGEIVTVTASNGECTKGLTTTVSCKSVLCGNGVVDTAAGETCDTGIAGVPCPADCNSVCGDGVAEAPVEDCDPANTDNCNALCKFRPVVCGDGFLTTVGANPEVCDGTKFAGGSAPAGKICSSTCTLIDKPVVVCGNGLVEEGEECDDAVAPFPSSPVSPTCSNTCKKISTADCVTCENAGDCFESVNNCTGVAAPFSNTQQTQCFDVMTCIEKNNCFDGTGTLGKCYCGSLALGPCGAAPFTGAGSPDGACVAEIKAGFPTFTTNSQILGGLSATNFPSGAALSRLSCQKGANGSACLSTCGFTAGGPAFP